MQKMVFIFCFLFSVITISSQSNLPQIIRFEADYMQINRADLVTGTVRVPVRWEVVNRYPIMNLVFEQILPDGRVVNVELPRSNPWVNSNEVGIVVPLNPENTMAEIQLQLRLYYFLTGETIDTATLMIPITDDVPATTDIHINSFSVTPTNAIGGDLLTISWDVSGVPFIDLSTVHMGNRRTEHATQYANVGTVSFSAPQGVKAVEVLLKASENVEQVITVGLSCSIAWFSANIFEDSCPSETVQNINATYQAFEHGYMLQHANTDNLWFYVYTTDTFYVRPSNMIRDANLFSGTVPTGLYLPADNFRDLWTGSVFVRDELGWATSPAQTYTMQYQESIWGLGTKLNRDRQFTLPDGTVISASISEF